MTQFIRNICSELERNDPTLTSLTIESSIIYQMDLPIFFQSLRLNNVIKDLSFYGVHFGLLTHGQRSPKRCIHALAKIISQRGSHRPPVESLTFWKNELDLEDMQILTTALKTSSSIKFLRFLGETGLNTQTIKLLANALKGNKSIEGLHLIGENIKDEGAIALASALEQNSALKHLKLLFTGIRSPGITAIANALTKNTTLTHLDLQGNRFNKKLWESIDQRLEFNYQLDQAMHRSLRFVMVQKELSIAQKRALHKLKQQKPSIRIIDELPLPQAAGNLR